MAGKGGVQCKLCRYGGGGICQQGFRKVHVREDPQCRLHGQVGVCNSPAPGLPPRGPEPSPTLTTAVSPPGCTYSTTLKPLTNGLPKGWNFAMKGVTWTPRRGRSSVEDEAEYALYPKRLCERYRVGEMADRFVRIVDRYMPKVVDENRAYVMSHPGKVKTMLQKAWGLRKRIRRRANKSQRQTAGRRGQASTSGEPIMLPNSEQRRWKTAGIWGGKACYA